MATATAQRKSSKKSTKKTVPKPQTLLIRALSPESLAAIEQAKQECGTSTNTAAASYMMEDYWFTRDALHNAQKKIRELEVRMERVGRALRMQQQAKEILAEEDLNQ